MNMREAFEKWTIINLMENNNDPSAFRQDELGRYRDSSLHLAYRAWQAACEWQKQKDAEICNALKAGQGEPVAWIIPGQGVFNHELDARSVWKYRGHRQDEKPQPLYTATTIPEGWYEYLRHKQSCLKLDYMDERDVCTCGLDAMLAAAPSPYNQGDE